jgi:hypothetical protein
LSQKSYNSPGLFVIKANELPLSGQVLLEIMRVVLARGVPFRFKARGWSMTPFIRDGDVITVAPFTDRPPGVGAVVAFIQPETGKLVVHRIVARNGAYSCIHGDGNAGESDGLIPPENLLGRVTHIERNGHHVWLGLGLERYLIALLSRTGLLHQLRLHLACCRKKII